MALSKPFPETPPTHQKPAYADDAPNSTSGVPMLKPAMLPTSGTGQSADLQRQAQGMMPFTPNNGNPRGAHNTPWNGGVPGTRRSRVGGGFIGENPDPNATLANGRYFGRGALTPVQQQRNQQVTEQYRQQQQMARTIGASPFGGGMTGYRPQQGLPTSQPQPGLPVPPGLNSGMGPQAPHDPHAISAWAGGSPEWASRQGTPDPQQRPQVGGYPMPQQPIYRGGQDPRLGRYRPPQIVGGEWQDNGGYSYNLPNPFGPYPNFGQGDYGYGPTGG